MAGRENLGLDQSGSDPRGSQRPVPPHVGNLPYIQPNTNGSASSLMEAVIGPASDTPPSTPPITQGYRPSALGDGRRTSAAGQAYEGSSTGNTGDRRDGGVDVLNDASGKVNEGAVPKKEDEKVVKELQEKVDKRRSVLPHLESELAALEAQIRAAEEKLARVQGSGVVAGAGVPSESARQ
nr:uncharacterized protein CI109_002896 [Kwoniella shandongensis]KAA5528738.1 hypothetical protein CI109_002896 [Kwoniella shandongensis]